MTIVRINAQIPWNVTQGSGGAWVGICEPLKLTVQSSSWAELMEDIAQTLNAVLNDLLSSNELEHFLKDHGWVLTDALPRRPQDVRFDVPFIPAMMGGQGTQRHLHQ